MSAANVCRLFWGNGGDAPVRGVRLPTLLGKRYGRAGRDDLGVRA